MFKSPWLYSGVGIVAILLLVISLSPDETGNVDVGREGADWLKERAEVIVAEQSVERAQSVLAEQRAYEEEWSKKIPYNDLLLEQCGASYYTLRLEQSGEAYECLKKVSTNLLRQQVVLLKSYINALAAEECDVFDQLLQPEGIFTDYQQRHIEIYLLDVGICAEQDRSLALTYWADLAQGDLNQWYASARLSDAYWRDDIVPRNKEEAKVHAYRAMIGAYGGVPGAHVDSLTRLLAKDSDLDPVEALWGVSTTEFARAFSWWLEGPWPLSQPLADVSEQLRLIQEDESGTAAVELAERLLEEEGLYHEAFGLLSIVTEKIRSGGLYFHRYKWRLKSIESPLPFKEPKDDIGRWESYGPTCLALRDLGAAADKRERRAIEEIARLVVELEMPVGNDPDILSGVMSNLIRDEASLGLGLKFELAEVARKVGVSFEPKAYPQGSYDYFYLKNLYCSI